jgi:hypothetical protein
MSNLSGSILFNLYKIFALQKQQEGTIQAELLPTAKHCHGSREIKYRKRVSPAPGITLEVSYDKAYH